ncbi:MAG: crossover junction endodeoxyribonuclease RuvC [Microscillaceae bacterium]|nr:crossover junction endodeoxyribonuclease RuvC [Microscillaceae bacterium]
MTQESKRIILGVDPGTKIMGYGLIVVQQKELALLRYGVINLSKYTNQALKLKKIAERMNELLDEYHPDEMALESPFYGKNIQVALKLGRAQGVAMAAALVREIPITEYAPRKIKQSVTGNGNASKEQVAAMLRTLLNFKEKDILLDATDALGVAVCHFFQTKNPDAGKYSGWNSFIKDNPDRIK